jgi:hypothetical protein
LTWGSTSSACGPETFERTVPHQTIYNAFPFDSAQGKYVLPRGALRIELIAALRHGLERAASLARAARTAATRFPTGLDTIAFKLNSRPRKIHGFRSPPELYAKWLIKARFHDFNGLSSTVALGT